MEPTQAKVVLQDVRFSYREGNFSLEVPELKINAGEKVALTGPSGSGKTTLLHLAAGIFQPHRGAVWLDQFPISQKKPILRRRFRIRHIGMVFQELELLEYLTVKENLLLPYRLSPELRPDKLARTRAHELARHAGIESTLDRYPAQLSQGERQRVAICRAVITKPRIIFADEPTGNLDPATSGQCVALLRDRGEGAEPTLMMVTHDRSLTDGFDRVIELDQSFMTMNKASVG